MSRLRAILDRLNDVEATIARVQGVATAEDALAAQLTLQSLENRREMLRDELADVTQQEHIEVCDYRIIPAELGSYAISGITTALHEFQDLITLVFDALTSKKPKQRAVYDLEAVEKTRLDFGYAYAGSLGVALTVRNERVLFDTVLDEAISQVFGLMKVKAPDEIKAAEKRYGPPTVRKLYSWSKNSSRLLNERRNQMGEGAGGSIRSARTASRVGRHLQDDRG